MAYTESLRPSPGTHEASRLPQSQAWQDWILAGYLRPAWLPTSVAHQAKNRNIILFIGVSRKILEADKEVFRFY